MGAWGIRSFDNDDAVDWVLDLGSDERAELEEAFDAVLVENDYLEAPECSVGLAAAEVVAALRGQPAEELPEDLVRWLEGRRPPDADLVQRALLVCARVRDDSELQELWSESEDYSNWLGVVRDLEGRLID